MKTALLLTISCMLLAVPTAGDTPPATPFQRVPLDGAWKIQCGDNPGYSDHDFDDSAWDVAELPGTMTAYARRKTGATEGIVWLRKTIRVDGSLVGKEIGLILGRIASADETFFNGVKIGGMGKFPPRGFSTWNNPRHYLVPSGLVRYGEWNSISIRVHYFIYAEMIGELAAAGFDEWNNDSIDQNFTLITHSYMIIGMALLLLVFFLVFFIARPREREYFFYCLQIIFGFFIVLDLCIHWNIYPSAFFRLQLLGISWVAINVAHILFLHSMYLMNRRKTEMFLHIFLVAWTVVIFVFAKKNPVLYGIILILSCTLLGFYHLSCHIYALIRKRPFARIFSLFGSVVIVCAMHDGLVHLSKFSGTVITISGHTFDRMIFHYGAFFLFLGTALVLVYRFLVLREELDDLNRSLEKYIIENALYEKKAASKTRAAGHPTLPAGTEEKVKKVIEYINNNYQNSISREGLASSVDIHPDNLSKLFNAYKNMRIGDYINELRIRDAAGLLVSTRKSVIDIAFAVGFESLRTFNRAFVKHMNTTPEKYRRA